MKDLVEQYNAKVREAFELVKGIGLDNPCACIQLIHIDNISSNGYNPNKVAQKEMRLLYESIRQDGYTMPIVVIESEEKGKYTIVDGFHRYFTMKSSKSLLEKNKGYLPCSVIQGDKADIIGSTIRHNKARGKHNVMSDVNCIRMMLETQSDEYVRNALGLTEDEFVKYKTTLAPEQTLKDLNYSKAYKSFFEVVAEIERNKELKCLKK